MFTLRLRAEEGSCFITITDLRLRTVPFDYQIKRMMAFCSARPQAATLPRASRLPGQPVETLYARWLPNAAPAKKGANPATPTGAKVRCLDNTMRGATGLLRRQMQALTAAGH